MFALNLIIHSVACWDCLSCFLTDNQILAYLKSKFSVGNNRVIPSTNPAQGPTVNEIEMAAENIENNESSDEAQDTAV